MNPQQYYGFASIQRRHDRGLSSNDPLVNLPTMADLQSALSLREEQANLNHLFNQPMRQNNMGLPTGLPAIDIATLQRTLAMEEGNRRRMSLQTQLDLLSRSNGGFKGPRVNNIDMIGLPSKMGLEFQQHNSTTVSDVPTNKRRKLSVGTWQISKQSMPASDMDASRSSDLRPYVAKQRFPLPPGRDGGTCLLRDNLTAFRIAWEALNQRCRSDDEITTRERELMVKEIFGKTIQLDKVLLYCLSNDKSR